MLRAAGPVLGVALLLAACGGEQWVRLSPDEQQRLSTPGIRVTAIAEQIVPLVSQLLSATEGAVIAEGRPLTPDERILARSAGVVEVDRVRVSIRERFPMPDDARLLEAARQMNLVFGSEEEAGRTQGYAILLKPGFAASREVLAHELVHVGQYERMGGIAPYARQYCIELLTLGYRRAPLEQEAYSRQSAAR